jgi:hypothetical protein
VTLPPGRPRLGTRPVSTGSPAIRNTTGVEDVAALAASVARLRARHARPRRCRRAANERDELAPFHSITSSARESKLLEGVSRRSLLRHLSGQWLAFLDHERRNGLNRRCSIIDALVDLASLDVQGITGLVGCGWFAFVVERKHSLLDIDD